MATYSASRTLVLLATIQGIYYVVTGLWALVSISTFQMVTGPKTDLWLVKTVGILVLISGLVFLVAALRNRMGLEVLILAVGNALGLAAIDIVYVAVGRISPIYLLDAIAELALVAFYFLTLRRMFTLTTS